jgi:hypothetical protein
MSQFTTRVELHDVDGDDYETLHAAMERQGFTRTITSDQGVTYHLPTAECNFSGDLSRGAVMERAKTAATTTRRRFWVLVTESAGRSWHGLPKV